MKVIEPPNKEKVEVIEFNQANDECRYCPCCGADFYGKKSRITREEYTVTTKHMFYIQTYKVMKYDCNKCGCKYESEPYNYEAQPLIKDDFFKEFVLILSVIGYIVSFIMGLILSIIDGSIIPFLAALWVIILISMNLYAHFNCYKQYNKNKFKPYKVYKKIGDQ